MKRYMQRIEKGETKYVLKRDRGTIEYWEEEKGIITIKIASYTPVERRGDIESGV